MKKVPPNLCEAFYSHAIVESKFIPKWNCTQYTMVNAFSIPENLGNWTSRVLNQAHIIVGRCTIRWEFLFYSGKAHTVDKNAYNKFY